MGQGGVANARRRTDRMKNVLMASSVRLTGQGETV